ncbi:TPA: replication initiator protein A [Streptococcus pyogenes]|uniref:replication initiator protein A n=1 Tax=Streptococcus dysgalactiae TaxID=1334 RepID=UPI002B1BE7A8|nr:replication initiator protein A [Streptococcus pyogenes]HEP4643518.1 replication initiator protein A [Streptococcus pyogenes]HEP4646799.1 replication initiator protein A [Streptococcus pyogenes]HEP4648599.1 replication initiator protein A [Streptococcus pyogenes]HEP4650346.1 replication initiator protein A [Streptococcus pyogenes]
MAYGRISLEQALNSDNFYQLPKVIIGTKFYSKLKAEAKLLFMLCRDRLSASLDSTRKGDMRFVDTEGDIFIYYAIDDLASDLGCGRKKVMKLKKDLIEYGLIDEVRQGLNKANRIYVKNVITDIQILNMEFEEAKELLNPIKSMEVSKRDFQKYQNDTSRNIKKGLHEVSKKDSTYIKESETKKSETKVIISDDEEKKNNLIRKVDNVSQYDKEYIWELVHDQLENDDYTKSNADYIMINFEKSYKFALENMKYIHSAEQIAEYVFNGLLAQWNQNIRKSQEITQ